ncbi:hypothetical protein AVEN_36438-1 [Araneus ventricosus]|uniref:Uncharacterized protein n=1 Tax=Araneus ventricosus TaxID=182803 RepID=A0A4Y2J6Q1_ARAVE|nr:hypothetical protein AVEN_36438-1 [Araneus ventricosus]
MTQNYSFILTLSQLIVPARYTTTNTHSYNKYQLYTANANIILSSHIPHPRIAVHTATGHCIHITHFSNPEELTPCITHFNKPAELISCIYSLQQRNRSPRITHCHDSFAILRTLSILKTHNFHFKHYLHPVSMILTLHNPEFSHPTATYSSRIPRIALMTLSTILTFHLQSSFYTLYANTEHSTRTTAAHFLRRAMHLWTP